jgi:hypothetical protein
MSKIKKYFREQRKLKKEEEIENRYTKFASSSELNKFLKNQELTNCIKISGYHIRNSGKDENTNENFKEAKTIAKYLESKRRLVLEDNKIPNTSLKIIASALNKKNCTITDLTIKDSEINYNIIFDILNKNTSITTLALSNIIESEDGSYLLCEELGEVLKKNTKLQELCLSNTQ